MSQTTHKFEQLYHPSNHIRGKKEKKEKKRKKTDGTQIQLLIELRLECPILMVHLFKW